MTSTKVEKISQTITPFGGIFFTKQILFSLLLLLIFCFWVKRKALLLTMLLAAVDQPLIFFSRRIAEGEG